MSRRQRMLSNAELELEGNLRKRLQLANQTHFTKEVNGSVLLKTSSVSRHREGGIPVIPPAQPVPPLLAEPIKPLEDLPEIKQQKTQVRQYFALHSCSTGLTRRDAS